MLKGSWPALITPFKEGGGLCETSLEKFFSFHSQASSSGWVVLGSTAEALGLSIEERAVVLAYARKHLPADKVVVGISAATTAAVLLHAEQAKKMGFTYGLVATPHYFKPSQEELIAHYQEVCRVGGMKIIMYTVPSRTGVDFSDKTIISLAKEPNMIGIKDAGDDILRVSRLKAYLPKNFTYLSGDDESTLLRLFAGGDGVISVAANVVPDNMQALCNYALSESWQKARQENTSIQPVFDALRMGGNPGIIKFLVSHALDIPYIMRKPLLPYGSDVQKEVLISCKGMVK